MGAKEWSLVEKENIVADFEKYKKRELSKTVLRQKYDNRTLGAIFQKYRVLTGWNPPSRRTGYRKSYNKHRRQEYALSKSEPGNGIHNGEGASASATYNRIVSRMKIAGFNDNKIQFLLLGEAFLSQQQVAEINKSVREDSNPVFKFFINHETGTLDMVKMRR